jgi:hypothetical protein
MKELIDKISSYNLFNYLFPGTIFVVILKVTTSYSFLQDNLIIGVFVYYFIGLVISRFGSLIVEPILMKISFLKFTDYSEFVAASKKDQKIDLLSDVNNMYRTLFSMVFLLLVFNLYGYVESCFPVLRGVNIYILLLLLAVIFLFAYRKQTNYIVKRIRGYQ